MKKNTFFMVIIFFMLVASAYADKITLKDGKVYEGKILGKSDRRYLFSLSVDGDVFPMSFFIDQIEKVEMSQDTVEKQIPYLKEVDILKIPVQNISKQIYEFSLYNKNQNIAMLADLPFTEEDVRKLLNKEELEYYRRYNHVLQRYADKLVEVQDIYANLTDATKEDFADACGAMDGLYFELNDIPPPAAFKDYHVSYLASVKATFLAFSALKKGLLEEATRQTKIADESKAHSIDLFRCLIDARRAQKAKNSP